MSTASGYQVIDGVLCEATGRCNCGAVWRWPGGIQHEENCGWRPVGLVEEVVRVYRSQLHAGRAS